MFPEMGYRRGGVGPSNAKAPAGLRQIEAGEADLFLAGFFAAQEGEVAAGQGKFFGEKIEEGVVGAALEGGSVDFYFEGIAEPAGDLVMWGIGDDF